MDGSISDSVGTRAHRARREEPQWAAEGTVHADQIPSQESLSEAVREFYAENGVWGLVLLVALSPLVLAVTICAFLWELNMLMGNLNPPWYKFYIGQFMRWSAPAAETALVFVFVCFQSLGRIFTPALLAYLLIFIPLLTLLLHMSGCGPGNDGLVACVIANDMFYFMLQMVVRMVGGFKWPTIVIFVLMKVVFGLERVGLVDGD
jgi:hypothetical protein